MVFDFQHPPKPSSFSGRTATRGGISPPPAARRAASPRPFAKVEPSSQESRGREGRRDRGTARERPGPAFVRQCGAVVDLGPDHHGGTRVVHVLACRPPAKAAEPNWHHIDEARNPRPDSRDRAASRLTVAVAATRAIRTIRRRAAWRERRRDRRAARKSASGSRVLRASAGCLATAIHRFAPSYPARSGCPIVQSRTDEGFRR
jgi:hypothetical protein